MLFIELKLPPTGDPSAPVPPVKTLGPAWRGGLVRGRGKQQFSTSKEILEKLKKLHPLPGMILEWRRISCALSKVNSLKHTQERSIRIWNLLNFMFVCVFSGGVSPTEGETF